MRTRYLIPILTLALAAQDTPLDQSTIRVDVNLARVLVSVRSKNGPFRSGLTQPDFRLFEDGVEQKIGYVTQGSALPLTIGILVDTSGSQLHLIKKELDHARAFLKAIMKPGDQGFLAEFRGRVWMLRELTSDPAELAAGLADASHSYALLPGSQRRELTPLYPRRNSNSTAFYDAIYLAANEMPKSTGGRRVLLVLTDGVDTSSATRPLVALAAAQDNEAAIFHLALTDYKQLKEQFGSASQLRLERAQKTMDALSSRTGGRVYDPSKRKAKEMFREMETELRSLYEIGYTPSNTKHDGKFREIQVFTTDASLEVRHRQGYRAPAK